MGRFEDHGFHCRRGGPYCYGELLDDVYTRWKSLCSCSDEAGATISGRNVTASTALLSPLYIPNLYFSLFLFRRHRGSCASLPFQLVSSGPVSYFRRS